MKTITRLILASWLALASAAAYGAFLPDTYPVIDLLAYPGASGDGTTDNAVPLQQAFSAAVNGGMIRIPCGVFKSTARPVMTLAAGKHVRIVGSGADCTELFMSGAISGPIIAKTDKYGGIDVENIAITTDQVGGSLDCLDLTMAGPDSAPGYGATSTINKVTCRGHNYYGAQTQFWGNGLGLFNVSSVNSYSYTFQGITQQGNAIVTAGDSGDGTYAADINVFGAIVNQCHNGFTFGDYIQGVSLTGVSFTGCGQGAVAINGRLGTQGGFSIANSQFNSLICSICISDPNFAGLVMSNNTIIVNASSTGVIVKGSNWIVSGNEIDGTSTTGTIGIDVQGTFGNGGVVAANHLEVLGTGIKVEAASTGPLALKWNQFINLTGAGANDYSINASATGVIISDDVPRVFASLPLCAAGETYSRLIISDSPTAVFDTHLTVGGSTTVGVALCTGAGGYFFR